VVTDWNNALSSVKFFGETEIMVLLRTTSQSKFVNGSVMWKGLRVKREPSLMVLSSVMSMTCNL